MPQAVTVTSPLGPGKLLFRNLRGREELGRLFEYRLEVMSDSNALALEDLVGQNVTVAAEFPDGRQRHFNGEAIEFRQVTRVVDKYFVYEVVLRPALWYLTCTSDCRIFQNKSVPDIIKAVLDDHGLTDVTRSLSGAYNEREYCVQYNETDFAFLSRLMEEEGIYYYFQHDSGKHTLVLADSLSAHDKITATGEIPFRPRKRGYAEDHVFDWNMVQQVQPGVVAHTDFDFTRPTAPLLAQGQISRTHGHSGMEMFGYPGRYVEKPDGETLARTRIEERQTPWEVIEGSTNSVLFAAGKLFKLTGYKREDQNREHLIVQAEFTLQMESDTASAAGSDVQDSAIGVYFEGTFQAIHSQRPFRTARTTPRPVVRGPQTAVVVGKSDEEIWTDEYGRVKVQFHWDRYGEKDENSSCWIRVAQPWAGKNWGMIHIPRIGQEVIVDFLEGDPDRPIITGRVYNADQPVPYALPDNQTQSGLKTRSTKEGDAETFNELRFEDLKDEEQIYFHAEKNFDRVVENNDTLKVGFEKQDAGDQTIDIYNHRTVTLEKGTDTLHIKEGSREATIETDDSVTLKSGNQTIKIEQGNQTITIDSGKCSIEAAQELVLKVGESTITIKPSSIELASVNITLSADGQLEATGAQTKVAGDASLDLDGGAITLN